jgi:hypothetical protein
MKSISFVLLFPIGILLSTSSCNKNKCADCHYDKAGAEIEIGEKCGDEMENLEANGYTDSTGTYVVHCGH